MLSEEDIPKYLIPILNPGGKPGKASSPGPRLIIKSLKREENRQSKEFGSRKPGASGYG